MKQIMIQGMIEFWRKVRVALTPRNILLKTYLSDGSVIYGQNRAGFGGRGIYVMREDIEPEYRYFTAFLPSGAVLIDVGANTGIYSIKAAQHLNGTGVVLALEPFPDVLAVLFKSIRANGFTNVRLRNVCAGERTEAGILWMNSNKPHEFSLVQHDNTAQALSSLVVALDDLAVWERLERLDYLKIDAEGAENEVLRGAATIIERHRPVIQVEITITDIHAVLPNYTAFRAPNSPNTVYIPNEHPHYHLPDKFGWERAMQQ